jgi:hypothetical protein
LKRKYFKELFDDLFNGFEVDGVLIKKTDTYPEKINDNNLYIYCIMDTLSESDDSFTKRVSQFHLKLRVKCNEKDKEQTASEHFDAVLDILEDASRTRFDYSDNAIEKFENITTTVTGSGNEITVDSLIYITYFI